MSINLGGINGDNNQIGDGNIMINNSSSIATEDWDRFSEFLESSLDKLDTKSDDYELAELAKQFVDKKDQAGLKKILVNNFATFMGNVFAGLASTELYNLMQTFMK